LVFFTKGCSGCHTIEGTSIATIGPDLTHIATVAVTRKAPLSAEEYIQESIEEPGVFVVEGYEPLMPELSSGIAEGELEDLVAFLLDQD
jgi:cytochrome c2